MTRPRSYECANCGEERHECRCKSCPTCAGYIKPRWDCPTCGGSGRKANVCDIDHPTIKCPICGSALIEARADMREFECGRLDRREGRCTVVACGNAEDVARDLRDDLRTRTIERDDERKNVAAMIADRDSLRAIVEAARPVLEAVSSGHSDEYVSSRARRILAMYPEAK